jgi:hypothetical protein
MISTTCQPIDSEPTYPCECSRVVVWAGSTPLASADIAADPASVTVQFAVTAGHLPRDARLDLLEAVFGLLGDQPSRTVRATIPLGDCDLLAGLTRHLTDVRTRAAGATCLIDART